MGRTQTSYHIILLCCSDYNLRHETYDKFIIDAGNGLQNCTKCVPPFVLYKHYCIRECPKRGWLLDSSRQECVKCHPSCARCVGPTANDCIACSHPKESLVGFSCKKECPHGTFPNKGTGFCEKCHPTCETCSGPSLINCITCAKDLIQNKSTGMCSSLCPEGHYSLGKECVKCHSDCRTCNGPESFNCLSCPNRKVLHNFTCIDKCPGGTFTANKDGHHQCFQCHPVCDTCYGPSIDNCLMCKNPLFIEGRLCVVQCSPNHVINQQGRSCHPCGKDCRIATRSNRSSLLPKEKTKREQTRLSAIAIAAGSIALLLFLVVFGILQCNSKRRMRYTIVKQSLPLSKSEDEEEYDASLMDDEDQA